MILATWWDLLGEDYNRFSFVASVGVSIIAVLVSVLILRRYLERKTRIAGLLAGFLITLTISVILDPIFLLIRALTAQDHVEIQSLFSLGLTGIANIFLVYFLKQYYYDDHDHWAIKPVVIIEASILPLLMIALATQMDEIPILVIHLVISFSIYWVQFLKSVSLQKILKKQPEVDVLALNGFKYIGLTGLTLFLTYFCFVMQEVASAFPEVFTALGLIQENASIFIGIGFIFGGFTSFFCYIGFIMPEWVRNIWTKKAQNSGLIKQTEQMEQMEQTE